MAHTPSRLGLDRAISSAKNASRLAARLGIRPHSIYKWLRQGRVPLKRVPDVAKVTGIPAHELRPDLPQFFPPPNDACRADATGAGSAHA